MDYEHNQYMTLDEITKLAAAYSDADQALREVVTCFDHDLQEVSKAHKKDLGLALRKARRAQAALEAAVEESPDLFVKPKTRVYEGIKFGLRKLPDSLEHVGDAYTIGLIREHLGEALAAALIKTGKESIVADALKNLSDKQLEKIGVSRLAGAQAVVATPVEGDVEKLIETMMKNARTLVEESAA